MLQKVRPIEIVTGQVCYSGSSYFKIGTVLTLSQSYYYDVVGDVGQYLALEGYDDEIILIDRELSELLETITIEAG